MASLFQISLSELWRFATALHQAGWTREIAYKLSSPTDDVQRSLSTGIAQRLDRVLFKKKSFVTPNDVISGYGCFICGSDRGVERLTLSYSCNLSETSELLCKQEDGYHILICSTCADAFYLDIVLEWLEGNFAVGEDRYLRKWDDGCPICRQVDQDGRTLVLEPPFFDRHLRWRFTTEYGFSYDPNDPVQTRIMMSTCGDCRGDFLNQVRKWCRGDFLPDHRKLRDWAAVELT